ncbi:NAD(P)H-dependent oxidoreductase subunit E [Bacteroidales bacterium OttesenSCG-928-B11]|nr:NAD(P)H-dependent oxidoreductase subunit E [Bacteroidales bacterium OttesenSCG-928-B11]MDL2326353.1 NAD(P)H-dependent oxidoreductase subunit E [Bacteroidales bacterium OttesenSCG-928-A14]
MTEESLFIKKLVEKYGKSREALLPILQATVRTYRYLSESAMNEIAAQLDISPAQVYGTATFYTFLDVEKRGKYVIRLCKSIIAEMKGKREIQKAIENTLKIKMGETTPDGLFTLLETNDIGWSDAEPSMLINEMPYTNLTPESVIEIISDLQAR